MWTETNNTGSKCFDVQPSTEQLTLMENNQANRLTLFPDSEAHHENVRLVLHREKKAVFLDGRDSQARRWAICKFTYLQIGAKPDLPTRSYYVLWTLQWNTNAFLLAPVNV